MFISEPEQDFAMSHRGFSILGVFLTPVVETLFFQTLPIFLVKTCRGWFVVQVTVSTTLFALAHFVEGVAVAAGLVGGFCLAFTSAHWYQSPVWTAHLDDRCFASASRLCSARTDFIVEGVLKSNEADVGAASIYLAKASYIRVIANSGLCPV